jgi:hypothetical protein
MGFKDWFNKKTPIIKASREELEKEDMEQIRKSVIYKILDKDGKQKRVSEQEFNLHTQKQEEELKKGRNAVIEITFVNDKPVKKEFIINSEKVEKLNSKEKKRLNINVLILIELRNKQKVAELEKVEEQIIRLKEIGSTVSVYDYENNKKITFDNSEEGLLRYKEWALDEIEKKYSKWQTWINL